MITVKGYELKVGDYWVLEDGDIVLIGAIVPDNAMVPDTNSILGWDEDGEILSWSKRGDFDMSSTGKDLDHPQGAARGIKDDDDYEHILKNISKAISSANNNEDVNSRLAIANLAAALKLLVGVIRK